MLRLAIIDDERRSRESLKAMIEKYCTGVVVEGSADDVESGIELLQRIKPDALCLDIQLTSGTGFDLLQKLPKMDFQLIFTTAFDEYAIKAFKFSAIDYLLKPIDVEELKAAIEKAKELLENNRQPADWHQMLKNLTRPKDEEPIITISTEQSYEFLKISEIIRVEAQGAYSAFVLTAGKKLLSSKLLKEYESILSDHRFFRVHHSHLVNLSAVERYVKTDGGYVVMNDGAKIPVSRRKKEGFIKSLMGK